MSKPDLSRRRFLRLCSAGTAFLLAPDTAAVAAPLSIALTTTKRTNDVRVVVKVSVDLPGFKLTNHTVGTYFVPYSGRKTFSGNVMTGLSYAFEMWVTNNKQTLNLAAKMSTAFHEASMSIVKNM